MKNVSSDNKTGICADQDPHRFLATEGLFELVETCPEKVLRVIPSICQILKKIGQIKDRDVSYTSIRFLQELIVCHREAPSLIVKHVGVLIPFLTPIGAGTKGKIK